MQYQIVPHEFSILYRNGEVKNLWTVIGTEGRLIVLQNIDPKVQCRVLQKNLNTAMFIIRETEPDLWTIGVMAPDWEPHSDHGNKEEAERICAQLNGADILDIPVDIRDVLMDIVFPRRGTEAETYIIDPRFVDRVNILLTKYNIQ